MPASSLDALLCEWARALPEDAPSRFAPLSVVFGRGTHWGLGLRSDTTIPFAGRVRLLHWLVPPHPGTPPGIVEDCQSSRLPTVHGTQNTSLRFQPIGRAIALPPDRAARRNLLSGARLMGLRGWDIPHDRHMAVTDLANGSADITGTDLPRHWHASWLLTLSIDGKTIELHADGAQIQCVSISNGG
ncbi:hypothetical protein [Caenibius sp. WL]|uniref:hypothetical protein n=1 Tax=Caenibius sp. WL TaxID=2872646 RepID=UPI001C992667|nr:hypothetical protein [Caenibius sp. WL]QZP09099.1 hypothetical protein K5X80_04805 [Caenibius sp. WL]